MPFTGLIARTVYAILAAVVTFVILLIIGAVIAKFDANIGDIVTRFAGVIALLTGLWYFFAGYRSWPGNTPQA